jgi:alpha-tubulin suppressor-like RCC1 family protein
MRALVFFFASALAITAGCDNSTGGMDSGVDGGGAEDAGRDSGPRPDAPREPDGGRDAGPSCTTGCAWVELALLTETSCARRENGQVRCWGRGQNGELGDGAMAHAPGCPTGPAVSEDCSARPVTVALPGDDPAAAISSHGGVSACAIDDDGDVHCWGEMAFQIGAMAPASRRTPVPFEGLTSIAAVSDSFRHVCARRADGTAVCAGQNSRGQTGTGSFSPEVSLPMPVVTPDPGDPTMNIPLTGVLEIQTSASFGELTCARTATTVYCWGRDEAGQLGTGDEMYTECMEDMNRFNCTSAARPLTGIDGSMVTQLAVGRAFACALMADGSAMCWGDNRSGQLGLGDNMQRTTPAALTFAMPAVQLVAGGSYACARLMDGSVVCWGSNDNGQLGDGINDHVPGGSPRCMVGTSLIDCVRAPVAVAVIDDATHIAAGSSHNCVIRESGEVWCWGANDKLQAGDGPTTRPSMADRAPRYSPVMVQGL